MAFYISACWTMMIFFVRKDDGKSGMPIVTAWKINLNQSQSGRLNQAGIAQRFIVNKVWGWRILDDVYYPRFISVICKCPGKPTRAPPFFPMLLQLALVWHDAPVVLIRLMSVPLNIREAVDVKTLKLKRKREDNAEQAGVVQSEKA